MALTRQNAMNTEFDSLIKRDQALIKLSHAQKPKRRERKRFGSLIKKAGDPTSLQMTQKDARVCGVRAHTNVGRGPF